MRKNVLSELESRRIFMSPAERRIADVILRNPRQLTELSMTELARLAVVSQGSVVNFSKRLVGGGYPLLKLKIAEAVAVNEPSCDAQGTCPEMKRTLDKMVEGATRAMKNTVEVNSDEALVRVSDMIMNASRVELCGLFRSAVVATDFCYNLIQIGISATYINDALTSAASASLLSSDSVFIAISLSGQTKDVIDAAKNAKENGVPIIAITCNRTSPLALLADELLVSAVSGGVDYVGENSEGRLSQMLIADTVCAYIGEKLGANKGGVQSRLRNILGSHSVFEK